MKKTLFLILCICFSQAYALIPCSEQFGEDGLFWVQEKKSTHVSGSNYFFKGVGLDRNNKDARTRSLGNALRIARKKCKSFPSTTKVVGRCSEKFGGQEIVYTRIKIAKRQCSKGKASRGLSKIYADHTKKINKQKKLKCTKTKANNCWIKGLLAWEDSNYKNALKYFDFSCRSGNSEACVLYALSHTNDKKIFLNLERACAREHSLACYELGVYEGQKRSPNKKRVFDSFSRACQFKNYNACGALGFIQIKENLLKRGLDNLGRACDNKIGAACTQMAVIESKKSEKRGLQFYEKGCSFGDLVACRRLGEYWRLKGEEAKGSKILEKNCKNRDYESCNILGQKYLKFGEKKKSISIYQISCRSGYFPHCNRMGILLSDIKKTREAEKIFRFLCAKKYPQGCGNLGDELAKNPNKKVITQAAFKNGCEINHGYSCFKYGSLLKGSNIEQAAEVLAKGCELKNAPSCYTLGDILKNNGQEQKAIVNYAKGCLQFNGVSCYQAARMYRKRGNEKLATKYFLDACKYFYPMGCAVVGTQYYHKKEIKKAKDLLKSSCDKGSPLGCFQLAKVYADENKNKTKVKYLKKACELKYKPACKALK